MTDFYTRLEQQLMTAASHRAERGAVRRAIAGRRPQLLTAAAAAAAAAVVAGVAFLPDALGPADAPRPAAPASSRPAPLPAPTGALSGIRVAVLNGTIQPGLARQYADRLHARGAVIGVIGNYYRQGIDPFDVVYYRPGAAALARRVAAVLRVPRVANVTGSDTAIAGDAKVVVVVGNEAMTRKVRPRWSHTGRGGGAPPERSSKGRP